MIIEAPEYLRLFFRLNTKILGVKQFNFNTKTRVVKKLLFQIRSIFWIFVIVPKVWYVVIRDALKLSPI